MAVRWPRTDRAALLHRRWLLAAATVFAAAAVAPGPVWTLALSVPLICGVAAAHWFAPAALEHWVRRGYLMLADALLVILVLLGAGSSRPLVLGGLCAVLLVATVVADRRKTLLACGAVTGLVAATATSGSATALHLVAEDALGLPLLLAAALHFGALAEALATREAGQAVSKSDRNELWALLDITDTITGSLDTRQVMFAIVERVGRLVDTPSCSILVGDGEAPGCLVMASKGHPETDMLEIDVSKYPEIRKALRTRQPVVIQDVERDPLVAPVREVLLSQGYRSMLVLPLVLDQEVLGALFLKSRTREPFSAEVVRFCRVVAGVCANAIKNARLFGEVKNEAALHRRTGEKLRSVLDGTPDMIVATDTAGSITEFNRGAEALTGRSVEAALGRPLSEILGGVDVPPGDDATWPLDVTFSPESGREVQVSLVSAPVHGPDGDCEGSVWIGRDVTQLRRVENSLAQAERLSSLGEVVAGVAHELNNPLSGVVGYAELLRANAEEPGQIQDLQRIVESAMRCQKIVFNLLSFARRHKPEKRYQSLNDCVLKTLDLKSYHLRSSRIDTVLELDPDLPRTSFDFHQLDQVILNLLNNAEQAISSVKREGKIVLSTGVEGDRIFLEVKDDGPGVPPAVRERIFDPFFTTKDIGKGTGLGLSVSYGIVQEHGGRIELGPATADTTGACFRLYLPIVEAPAEVAVEPDLDVVTDAALEGRRILVAEDEPVVLELLSRLLADDGADVTQALDGLEAWERIGEQDFDAIVVDLRMPNLSGQELYERVAEQRPELLRRFVFATGDLVRQDSVAFLERLPNRILAKPLEQETVRRILSQVIRADSR